MTSTEPGQAGTSIGLSQEDAKRLREYLDLQIEVLKRRKSQKEERGCILAQTGLRIRAVGLIVVVAIVVVMLKHDELWYSLQVNSPFWHGPPSLNLEGFKFQSIAPVLAALAGLRQIVVGAGAFLSRALVVLLASLTLIALFVVLQVTSYSFGGADFRYWQVVAAAIIAGTAVLSYVATIGISDCSSESTAPTGQSPTDRSASSPPKWVRDLAAKIRTSLDPRRRKAIFIVFFAVALGAIIGDAQDVAYFTATHKFSSVTYWIYRVADVIFLAWVVWALSVTPSRRLLLFTIFTYVAIPYLSWTVLQVTVPSYAFEVVCAGCCVGVEFVALVPEAGWLPTRKRQLESEPAVA